VIKVIESGYFQEKTGEFPYRQYKEIQNKEKIIVQVNELADDEELPMEILWISGR
jgi:methylmalonyl-CoA mutase N-terminal domain/subunit